MFIRAATPADAAEIGRVHVASFRAAHAGLLPEHFLANLSAEERGEMWRRMLIERADTHFLLAAEDDGRIAGFAAGGPAQAANPDYPGELYTIYLLPEAQGKGTGRELLSAAFDEFRRRSLTGVLLWVLKENAAARGFYEHMGGVQLDEKQEEIQGVATSQVAYGWELMSA